MSILSATLELPVWAAALGIFMAGVVVGKALFEPRGPRYPRPRTPPEPGYTPKMPQVPPYRPPPREP